MQGIKVSVIVPIYNTEKFLRKCIESIVNQTLEEIEIILINDGSTDNSYIICEEYSRKYPKKIRYINNKNIGCSATRNLGISLAKGKYVAFVDSDDYIEQEMYQEMYEKAQKENLDIVVCGIKTLHINKKIKISLPVFPKDYYSLLSYKGKISNPVNKIFKKSKVKNIKFVEKIHSFEDFNFCFKVYLKTRKIDVVKKSYYNYIHHGNNSIFNLEKRLGIFIAFNELYHYLIDKNYIKDKKIMKKFYENFNFYAIKGVFFMLLNPKLVSIEEYKKYNKLFYEELREIKYLPLKSKLLVYYYIGVIWSIRKFNLYDILKKIKNKIGEFYEGK